MADIFSGASGDFGSTEDSCCKDGPVLSMMNKRLRALKKKFNRITQIEEGKLQGKTINKEQEDVLKTKPQVSALIDEYERLRWPLLLAVKDEIAEKEKEWIAAKQELKQEQESEEQQQILVVESNGSLDVAESEDVSNTGGTSSPIEGSEEAKTHEADGVHVDEDDEEEDVRRVAELEEHLADLIQLLYFAQLFDVKPQGDTSYVWTKYHERTSCLSYDFVTDDNSAEPLTEGDLQALATFGSLVTSRPPNTTLSHKEALQNCIAHARNWLLNSNLLIDDGFGMTYTDLRERLNRILATEYFTMTPELQTVTPQIAEAYGSRPCGYLNLDPTSLEEAPREPYGNGDSAGNISDSSGNNADISQVEGSQVTANENSEEEHPVAVDLKPQAPQKQQQPHGTVDGQPLQQPQQSQQQQQRYSRQGRGGGSGSGGNYGRGGRGFSGGRASGRGNRGGGGGQNGRGNGGGGGQGQYYDQTGGYYQRKTYYDGSANNNGGGGGGRRGRGGYNNNNNNHNTAHANGSAAATHPEI